MKPTRLPNLPNIVLLLNFLFLVATNANAQNNDQKNSLKEDSWALQFQIAENFSLKAFQGFALSAKKHFYNNSALRVGVGLNITISDDDNVSRRLPADTLRQSEKNKSNVKSIDISTQYLFYPNPDADINVFFGAGPLLSFFRNKVETEKKHTFGSIIDKYNLVKDEQALAIGASVLLGVEWFASKNISFLGEYALSFEYYTSKLNITQSSSSSIDKVETKINTKYFRVYPLLVKFGLSVYF